MIQFDFTLAKTYCKSIGSLELLLYRVLSMAAFYSISYLRRPSRILRILKFVILRHSQFQPLSVCEQRIFDFLSRRSLRKNEDAVGAMMA